MQVVKSTYLEKYHQVPATAYEFNVLLRHLEQKGKVHFGDRFRIDEADYPVLLRLFAWFIGDLALLETFGLEFQKGILLSGPVGCGKTSLMKLMRHFSAVQRRPIVKPCRDISFEFIRDGFEVMNRYGRQAFDQTSGTQYPRPYCFDDLGSEQALKYFGNECNVMGEILLSRYELYHSRQMITHVTTNLAASEIESLYGNRVRSRMREQFNLVAFERDAIDKRI